MLTILLATAIFIAAFATFCLGYALGYVKAPTRVETVERHICKYCSIDFTGLPELDSINHALCINRSESDIKKLQAKQPKIVEPSKDEYFHTHSNHKWYYSSKAPANAQPVLKYISGNYWAAKVVVYRNGKEIDASWVNVNAVDAHVKSITDLDKHKRRHRVS